MTHFSEMGLPTFLTQSLNKLGFIDPTPIQAKTIPIALQSNDIMGSAETGTGKTLAFALPLIAQLSNEEDSKALILAPTRELAQQVANAMTHILGPKSRLKIALLIGGEAIFKQLSQLKTNPRIIIGTPGRVIDHLGRKTIQKDKIRFLVLDETDRMFDMGFGIQLDEIITQLPKERQTLMFSATFPQEIEKLAAKFLKKPQRISVGSQTKPPLKLKLENLKLDETAKYETLLTQLRDRTGSILVFVKTKIGAERLAKTLTKEAENAYAIHGDLRQHKRERVIKDFRKGRYRVMVATDIAARGLDIPHLEHVINYDLPHCPEDYIHRIGRTARAGAEGSALNMISAQDSKKWAAIQRLINPNEGKAQKTVSKSKFSKEKSDRFDNNRSDKKAPQSKKPFFNKTKPNEFLSNQEEENRSKKNKRNEKFLAEGQKKPASKSIIGYAKSNKKKVQKLYS